MRAMILAAGRGERMRPLTDHTPKPLLPVGGKPMIQWHIAALAQAGVREIVINHAWLGSEIERVLGDGAAWGVRLVYSAEAVALETAGGIAQARPLLGEAPFILLSGDVYTAYPMAQLVEAAHDLAADAERLAHVIMVPNPSYHAVGDWGLNAQGRIEPQAAVKYCYASMAVIHPALVAPVVPGTVARLGPLLAEAAAAGRVSGELYTGAWFNVGTPAELAAADCAAGRIN